MTNGNKSHADVVRENAVSQAHDQCQKYQDMLAMAERAHDRGDVVGAAQMRRNASEYADTRMTEHARRLAGLK